MSTINFDKPLVKIVNDLIVILNEAERTRWTAGGQRSPNDWGSYPDDTTLREAIDSVYGLCSVLTRADAS